ncbi:hypothetical protein HPB49_010695 [Dermacentor silvarum]|uniref:Uncharacterized protein n=1 Tax=Dermacentor silvarum TaxID=543639 RepID=A0ACB8DIV0_DERSI|nr:hypothetical protein HPB49_010695 [Dermacentor silvarum]
MVAVVGNPDVTGENRRHALSPPSSLWMNDFWGRPMADPRSHKSYRPLTVLSFRANFYANGRQVRGYHMVNVVLHCACSVLVAVIARCIMRITALHACFAATLFAAHPVHTEAVSSIVGRAEVLCCFFFLLSFLCYHWHCLREIAYRCLTDRDLAALAALTALLLCFRLWILQGSFPEFSAMDNPASFSPMSTTSRTGKLNEQPSTTGYRLILSMKAAGGSRQQCCCYYSTAEQVHEPSSRLVVPLLLTVLPFLPASNLFVTVGFVVAERVLYIPSIGVTLLVAEGLCRLHTRCSRVIQWGSLSSCFVLVLLFAARTWSRNGVWVSREALFESGIKDLPENAKMHYNYANLQKDIGNSDLGRQALQAGDRQARPKGGCPDSAGACGRAGAGFLRGLLVAGNARCGKGRLAEAERLHQMALSSDDRNADARNNYGTFLQSHARSLRSMNLNMQAESLYKRALAVEPDPQVMDNLAVFYVSAGRLDEARQLFEEIHRLFPEHRDSNVHHAQLLIRLRSFRVAEDLLLDVIENNSTDRAALHTAALLYNHINRTVEALDYVLKALKLCDVDDLLCARIHSDHGDILKDLGDLSSSAQSYEVAIRLDPNLAHAHLNLAVIRHLENDYSGAFRHYQVALSLDPKNKLIIDNMAKLRRRITKPLPFHDCV